MLKEQLAKHNTTIFSPVVLREYLSQNDFTGLVPVIDLEAIKRQYLKNKYDLKPTLEDLKNLKSRIYTELLTIPKENKKILLDVIKYKISHDLNGEFKVPVNSYFPDFENKENNIYIPLNKQLYTEQDLLVMKECVYTIESIYREYLQLNTAYIYTDIFSVIKKYSTMPVQKG